MCYASPGPRCSPHVKTELDAAHEEWTTNPSDKTLRVLKRKQDEYDTTPEGQEALRAQIADDGDPDGILTARLERGATKRQKALEAMKKGNGGLPPLNRIRRGLNDPDDPAGRAVLEQLDKDATEFRSRLTDKEESVLVWYGMAGNEGLNARLLGGEVYEKYVKENEWAFWDGEATWHEKLDRETARLTSAFEKVKKPKEPRILYRYHRVMSGTAAEYAQQFQPGSTFTFKGYTSTSVDPDLMVYTINDRKKRDKIRKEQPREQVVFEISSRNGMILHEENDSKCSWSVQDDEREILLQPGSRMRVVGVKEGVTFESTRRTEDGSGKPWGNQNFYRKGKRAKVTVIQLVDITDEESEDESKS